MDTFLVLSLVSNEKGKKGKLTFVGSFVSMADLQVCCREDLLYVITGIMNGKPIQILKHRVPSLTSNFSMTDDDEDDDDDDDDEDSVP